MKLYLISQNENASYDTYDAAVVAAPDEETAKLIHPKSWQDNSLIVNSWGGDDWASGPQHVKVLLIGTAARGTKTGVILASSQHG